MIDGAYLSITTGLFKQQHYKNTSGLLVYHPSCTDITTCIGLKIGTKKNRDIVLSLKLRFRSITVQQSCVFISAYTGRRLPHESVYLHKWLTTLNMLKLINFPV